MKNSIQNNLNPYQAIILAGGLGTRLRSAVSDVPKCMAPVVGKPFLHYVINYFQQQGVAKFIFSLGYMSEIIEQFLILNYPNLQYQIVIETEPLGTGGAIQLACSKATEEDILILNGDTFFEVDVQAVFMFHQQHDAACTLSLKTMQQFDRYGVVEMDSNSRITSFKEKQFYQQGLINGGVYVLNKAKFLIKNFNQKFSFEKDYLEEYVSEGKFTGIKQEAYFIDIGIPEDFNKAQAEFNLST
jgi:D-glycero-alpha-D-manno-heptose 1-phosphate guanylyltransferase